MGIELRRLIGHRVVVMGLSFVDNEKLQSAKRLAVGEAGIWIESQEAVDQVIGILTKEAFLGGPRLLHSLTDKLRLSWLALNPRALSSLAYSVRNARIGSNPAAMRAGRVRQKKPQRTAPTM